MSFNELNSVEYYIIHELSGTNLNDENISERFPDQVLSIVGALRKQTRRPFFEHVMHTAGARGSL